MKNVWARVRHREQLFKLLELLLISLRLGFLIQYLHVTSQYFDIGKNNEWQNNDKTMNDAYTFITSTLFYKLIKIVQLQILITDKFFSLQQVLLLKRKGSETSNMVY